ncbi:MAG: VOC family protein [Balneolaceae bacterium]|nr:VOC family protein [Balneolaceae bacterium]
MSTFAKNTTSTIIPGMRYEDAPAAIEWLCDAFGFEKHVVVPNDDGTIAHAQLTFGNGMIMLGSVRESNREFDKNIKQPNEIGGAETQTAYIIVSNADAVYARAKEADAEIVMDIKDEDYGGRGFSCRDPEGHLWNFGTYDPWEETEAES